MWAWIIIKSREFKGFDFCLYNWYKSRKHEEEIKQKLEKIFSQKENKKEKEISGELTIPKGVIEGIEAARLKTKSKNKE